MVGTSDMENAPQQVIANPPGTYLVTYRGSLVSGEYVTIPRFNRREGDLKNNPLVAVVAQNCSGFTLDFPEAGTIGVTLSPDSSLSWWQWPRLRIHDGTNNFCAIIAWPNAWRLDTDQDVKLSASAFTYGPCLFAVAAFYRMPDL